MSNEIRGSSSDTEIGRAAKRESLERVRLPSAFSIRPDTAHHELHFLESFTSPSLEQRLVKSLCPAIGNPELLTPGCYQSMLERAQGELKETARGLPLENQKSLQITSDLMDKQKELQDLLNTYRHVLHQA